MLTFETQSLGIEASFGDYVWPSAIDKLRTRLRRVNGGLIAVVGLQGVGKSRACTMLAYDLKIRPPESSDAAPEDYAFTRTQMLKWPINGDWRAALFRASHHHFSEDMLAGERAKLRYDIKGILQKAETILIDLPDYTTKDVRVMTRNSHSIQEFWNEVIQTISPVPNLVIFFQKELLNTNDFFFRKMDLVELKPFTAEELAEAYKKKFNDTYPFDEAGLLEVAKISRGVFRRFKKYIHKCLEEFETEHQSSITKDLVRRTITIEIILADMELQLSGIFPKAEHRTLAVSIIEHARANPNLSQKDLSKALEIDDDMVSRILRKLEAHGYIHREPGERSEKKVTVNLDHQG